MNLPPEKLYKYVPSARVDIVQNLTIRFTQPSALNDPFEFNLLFSEAISTQQLREHYERADKHELIMEAISRLPDDQKALLALLPSEKLLQMLEQFNLIIFNSEQIDDIHKAHIAPLTPKLKKEIYEGLNKTIGILSLSATPVSPPMWANYAENSTGFVLEFDTAHSFFNGRRSDKDEFYYLREVIYADRQPSATMMDMPFDTFVLKSRSWEYEQEWRMLLPLDTACKKFTTPSGDDVSLFSVPATSISKIIIGLNTKEQAISELVGALSKNGNFANIDLEKIQKGSTGFELTKFKDA
ncbi:DUF2971 domain-containing protein [Pseudomonas fragariae (ex Marin et al. 2024)]|uniref:DUF2971 domain-containing protein n=1 Tax=Pseudomonas TaxID=286 RepID=UPI00044D0D4F|nr:DUF2971 domain-containing protein [Pseudomonas syringae]AKF47384.1 Protein of unknown function (DUF2971) [Pseudomonas syringae pv. syringae B301D]EXL28566.1 hypothetical protein PssB301D_05260 [Pseudomonas syringae pv. syringae str. B301D-R]